MVTVCSAAAFVVCYVEHADRLCADRLRGPMTQVLQKAAWKWFHVSDDAVFLWEYNKQALSSKQFVYLLNDIGKALVCVNVM